MRNPITSVTKTYAVWLNLNNQYEATAVEHWTRTVWWIWKIPFWFRWKFVREVPVHEEIHVCIFGCLPQKAE
jgi:hypothetical protein